MTRTIVLAALAASGCGEDQLTAGRRFVVERGCADCHRAPDGTLSGSATAQPGTTAYPSNLTPDRATGLGAWSDVAIVRAIRFAVDDEQRPLCAPMPHFDGSDPARPYLGDIEGNAIAAYLRSEPPVARADIPESRCSERGSAP
jgi:hypothetical protein